MSLISHQTCSTAGTDPRPALRRLQGLLEGPAMHLLREAAGKTTRPSVPDEAAASYLTRCLPCLICRSRACSAAPPHRLLHAEGRSGGRAAVRGRGNRTGRREAAAAGRGGGGGGGGFFLGLEDRRVGVFEVEAGLCSTVMPLCR